MYLSKQFTKASSPVISLAVSYSSKKGNKNCSSKEEILCSGHLNGTINKYINSILSSTFGNKSYSYNNNTSTKKPNTNNEDEELNLNLLDNSLQNMNVDKAFDITTINTKSQNPVWTLCFINNKFIASGNKEGECQVWDLKFGVLVARFKEHDGDILSIAYNNSTKSLYFTGCDSIVINVAYFPKNNEFKIQSKVRPQSHDINCIICLEDKSVLVTGGITSDICLVRLDNGRFIESYGKKGVNSNSKLLYINLQFLTILLHCIEIKRHISCFETKSTFSIVSYNYTNGNNSVLLLQRLSRNLLLWEVDYNKDKIRCLVELNSSVSSIS